MYHSIPGITDYADILMAHSAAKLKSTNGSNEDFR
jgi:hypothetical protein